MVLRVIRKKATRRNVDDVLQRRIRPGHEAVNAWNRAHESDPGKMGYDCGNVVYTRPDYPGLGVKIGSLLDPATPQNIANFDPATVPTPRSTM